MRESSRMSRMVTCPRCGAAFPYVPAGRAQASPSPARLEFEAKRRELRLQKLEAGHTQVEDRGISPADPEVSNDRDVTSIGRSGEDAKDIAKEAGSTAEPMGELPATLTPKPRFDRKANHRRYMREWRRKRAALRKP